ncbi:MAG: tetratricopeptide repeat protein, partial [Chloroflexota bacterium]
IAGRPAARPDDLAAAIETADRLRARNPDHFGLCFGLGRAGERAAAAVVWDRRTPWIERALDYYEDSVRLALAGKIAGSDRVPEAMASAWEPGPTLQQRALLAASFQAGLLRSAEFRARDPRAGIAHLTRVVTLLRGYHPAWYFLGEAYLLDHQFDAAERAWTEALRRSPDSPILTSVLRNLPADRVHHLVKQGDWHAVLLAIECLPEDALPVSERFTIEGDARLAAGDSVGARRCWLAALAADRLAVGVRHRLRRLDHREVGDHVL